MDTKINYSKEPTSIKEQIKLLKFRGLVINDEEFAEHILLNISYYRLSAYFYHFLELPKENHTFKSKVSFKDIFDLYCFDSELRQIISNELEKLEISFRTQISNQFSLINGAFWIKDSSLFYDSNKRIKIIEKLEKDLFKSDEVFIKSFTKKYSDSLPPSWISMEILTFGQLSEIYKALKYSKERKSVADYYGLTEKVFVSWLHTLVYVRNLSAHHCRVWNRTLGVKPYNPDKPRNIWLSTSPDNSKIFMILSMIMYLLKTVNPNSNYSNKILSLLEKYPQIDVKNMGFSNNWDKEKLWKN